MKPKIEHVIHVVWPKYSKYPDKDTFQAILASSFVKCLRYASDVLQVIALAIPAESLGTRDTLR